MPSTAAKAVRMSKKDMEKYRRLLEEKKTTLSSDLAKTRSGEEETTEESTQDIADKAVSSYTREFLYSLTDGERSTLLQIDDAIDAEGRDQHSGFRVQRNQAISGCHVQDALLSTVRPVREAAAG